MVKNRTNGKLLGIAIKESKRSPMVMKERIKVTMERGLEGDHRGNPGDRQVTVISQDSWDETCHDLKKSLPWTARRANLLVTGIQLKEKTDNFLRIGEVDLKITGETKPCERMDEYYQGLQEALKSEWRGGVTCRVITPGKVKIGDVVTLNASVD
jgi:MOSC domain-containing protein YiiM